MAIDERARLALHQRLEVVLGSGEADTMMSYRTHGVNTFSVVGFMVAVSAIQISAAAMLV